MMNRWLNAQSDHGGVLWGILCCWLMVAANFLLLDLHVAIFYVVPFDVFGVPLLVTAAFALLRTARNPT
jgi:hypothetical protein